MAGSHQHLKVLHLVAKSIHYNKISVTSTSELLVETEEICPDSAARG